MENLLTIINLIYIVSAVLFILGIKMLGNASTAKKGNFISAVGMLLAVVATLINKGMSYPWIVAGIIIGSLIGVVFAQKVKMTGMPELVALFNGFGGLASLVVACAEFDKFSSLGVKEYLLATGSIAPVQFTIASVALAILIGGITFTGSLIAYLRLSGKMSGRATLFGGQMIVNAIVSIASIVVAIILTMLCPTPDKAMVFFYVLIGLSLILGILVTLPIGGGDMPVVISLLNSFSGLAACAAGFVILNTVLIVAGCLVGASGFILTVIMCKSMNRNLGNVLFSGFGSTKQVGTDEDLGEMKALSTEDAYYVLEAASSVVFVPGYGMAVAQAQHAVKELATILEKNGAEVRFAIHPVAGRMPGHMNVLLAEADVPYEQLQEMDDVNPIMSTIDVAIVIGANDVVNPAANTDPNSPIYGMPIINVDQAKTTFCLKRGSGAGFSGLVNKLFYMPNTRMIYGDAKETISSLVTQFDD